MLICENQLFNLYIKTLSIYKNTSIKKTLDPKYNGFIQITHFYLMLICKIDYRKDTHYKKDTGSEILWAHTDNTCNEY